MPKEMRHKHKLHRVREKGTAPDPIATLSADEKLADIALSLKPDEAVGAAGSRARTEMMPCKKSFLATKLS